MKLSRQEFEDRHASGHLRIAFVGMSNIGKSYTAMRLSTKYDFDLIEVDKLIWEELGHSDMEAFATWQGQPYSEGYKEREAQSIALETKATLKALEIQQGNQILDTTGSVIYTGTNALKALCNTHYVVYIKASEHALETLKVQYFKSPKPLIWNGHFTRDDNETNENAILKSYPKLLKARSRDYESLADQTLASDLILDSKISVSAIFEALKPTG